MRQIFLLGILNAIIFSLLTSTNALAQEQNQRRWDQEKAVEMVNQMIAIEQKGAVWDQNINWTTDVEAAVSQAKKEGKPIFVYWYVKKVDASEQEKVQEAEIAENEIMDMC